MISFTTMDAYTQTKHARQGSILSEEGLLRCDITPATTVLVALSGGADSVALLLALKGAAAHGRIKRILACHVHHGIRGASADRDADFCRALCQAQNIPFYLETADVPAIARERGLSLETAAREARYAALEDVRRQSGADCIAVAHHRGDQAETLLMHLIRGTGLKGLTGMRHRNGTIVRPLLTVSREEILAFLETRRQPYCTDETNAEVCYTRNRIRRELLPLLERLNPEVESALAGLCTRLQPDEDYLEDLASLHLSGALGQGDGTSVDAKELGQLAVPIRIRAIRQLLTLGGVTDITHSDLTRVDGLLYGQGGRHIEVRDGIVATLDAGRLCVQRSEESVSIDTPFLAEGSTHTPHGTFTASLCDRAIIPTPRNEAYLDYDALPQGLRIRTRRAGDRFYPLGAPGDRLLSDYFTDKKLRRTERDRPLLAHNERIYWVPGGTVTELARVSDMSTHILHIVFREENES